MYADVFICIYIHAYTCMWPITYVYACNVRMYMHVGMSICKHIYTVCALFSIVYGHVRMYACTCICTYAYVRTFVYMICMHTYVHTVRMCYYSTDMYV